MEAETIASSSMTTVTATDASLYPTQELFKSEMNYSEMNDSESFERRLRRAPSETKGKKKENNKNDGKNKNEKINSAAVALVEEMVKGHNFTLQEIEKYTQHAENLYLPREGNSLSKILIKGGRKLKVLVTNTFENLINTAKTETQELREKVLKVGTELLKVSGKVRKYEKLFEDAPKRLGMGVATFCDFMDLKMIRNATGTMLGTVCGGLEGMCQGILEHH